MKVPILLYDVDNNLVPIHCLTGRTNFFIKSFQNFSIEIIEGSATIYSVKLNPDVDPDNLVIIQKDTKFTDSDINHNYTIFVHRSQNNQDVIKFKVIGIDNIPVIYELTFRDTNYEPDHYRDFLVNKYLPTYQQLVPALIDKNDAELTKRLLLDYKTIVKYKGTIVGIEKFLNLIGFNPEQIRVYSEFITPEQIKTTNPDTTVDIKTGDYHVLFDNFITDPNDRWTPKNLPKRLLFITNLEEFFESLYYAISLANVYFTLPEQDISFFGLNYSANSEEYLSIVSRPYVTWEQNPHNFQKHININMWNFVSQEPEIINYIISDCLNTEFTTIYKTESKYKRETPPPNNELYIVDEEIPDTAPIDLSTKIIFGNIIHFEINSQNTYIEYQIRHVSNELSAIKQPLIWLGETPHKIIFVANKTGDYIIQVKVTNGYNNQEVYNYNFRIDEAIANIDFEMFNSVILESVNDINDLVNITSDISSPSETSSITDIYILPINNVPEFLNIYFDIAIPAGTKFLTKNSKYVLPEINKNFIVNQTSEIPIDYMDNWVDIIAIKKPEDKLLKIRYIDAYTLETKYSNIGDVIVNKVEVDNQLFVTEMDIYESMEDLEDDIINQYIFISTQHIGIQLIPELFDLVFVDTSFPEPGFVVESIYDLLINDPITHTKKRLPINYDYPLFHRNDSPLNYPDIDLDDAETIPIVKSIFPRLTKNNFNVMLGETILCRTDKSLITTEINILWEIRNAFTDELIFATTDYTLKYRVNEKMIYKVVLKFAIRNDINSNYQIIKESLFSSL